MINRDIISDPFRRLSLLVPVVLVGPRGTGLVIHSFFGPVFGGKSRGTLANRSFVFALAATAEPFAHHYTCGLAARRNEQTIGRLLFRTRDL